METSSGTTERTNQTEQMTCGDVVEKHSGDYTFIGIVVSIFPKLSGKIRFVVENPDGILHIFSPNQLRKVRPPEKGGD